MTLSKSEQSFDLRFYTFRQNNSGGYIKRDPELGIGDYVLIQARSARFANTIARALDMELDDSACSCCGARWSSKDWDDMGTARPEVYGIPVEELSLLNEDVFIHYANGRVVRYFVEGAKLD